MIKGTELLVDIEVVTTRALRGGFLVRFVSEEGTECPMTVELHVAQVGRRAGQY